MTKPLRETLDAAVGKAVPDSPRAGGNQPAPRPDQGPVTGLIAHIADRIGTTAL